MEKEQKFRITSDGETISLTEFNRRRSEQGYCGDCGAKIIPKPLVDRCASCSEKYARAYYEGEKYPSMSGMPGGE